MKKLAKDTQSVYLFPQQNHTYGAAVSAAPPLMAGAVKLTDIKNYPVDVFYSRTDLNGSLCYEVDHCLDQTELLSSLNWCGRCRYMLHLVWDFDLRKTEATTLVSLMQDASRYRLSLIEKEWDKIAGEDEELPQPALSNKINAAQQNIASAGAQNTHKQQEPTH